MQKRIKAASKMSVCGKEAALHPPGLNALLVYLSANFSVTFSPTESGITSGGRVRRRTEKGEQALLEKATSRGKTASRAISSRARSAARVSTAREEPPEELYGNRASVQPQVVVPTGSKRLSGTTVLRRAPVESDEIEEVESEEEQDEADGNWGNHNSYKGFPENLDDADGDKEQDEDEEPPSDRGKSAASTTSQLPARVTSSKTMYEDELHTVSSLRRKWEQQRPLQRVARDLTRLPGPTSTVNAIAMGDSAVASARAEMDARTMLTMVPSSVTATRRAAPEDTRTEPPKKRAKYKKPSASEFDDVTKRILSLANEIFQVNLLIRGPYDLMPRENLGRPLQESENIMKIDEVEKKSLPVSFEADRDCEAGNRSLAEFLTDRVAFTFEVIALAATALDHAIKEWSTGIHRSLEFTQSSASAVFSGHMKVLSNKAYMSRDDQLHAAKNQNQACRASAYIEQGGHTRATPNRTSPKQTATR
ncbi:hypothetical protein CALCODRAFT_510984 [Calocera cornea HHB12733]|uniref:DUF6532 domain-containing protein n=1 Tax=Calocera cornea HHB12733 TaxID=1353952 RepID=A0A165E4D6_9BASI|nr:hypothetical protein CALCODRAFT_510984 [Calocera cornea HHB12733]